MSRDSGDLVSGAIRGEADPGEAFARDGYVLMPAFFSADEVGECLKNLERYITEVVPGLGSEEVFYEERENPETLKQLQSMHLHDEWFGNFFQGRVSQLACQLLGSEVIGRNMQFFNKPAGIGKPTPAHQDGFYFKLNPPLALTMWLALDPADEENGCVRYVKASHLKGMRPHALTNTLGFSQGVSDFGKRDDEVNEVTITALPGDLLAHHALTVHRAEGNRSPVRERRALGFIFYSVDAVEDPEGRDKYRRQLATQQEGKI
ncbi:MAG: phytanoyl-CoA dioxygenase family protein [Verrucomicrobiaceae bacterium]|nr:phytanoyl-CoA dioxygenase family protein [Verrucomicrobiaceae bacterium]